jgi:hypothetical protein
MHGQKYSSQHRIVIGVSFTPDLLPIRETELVESDVKENGKIKNKKFHLSVKLKARVNKSIAMHVSKSHVDYTRSNISSE